MFWISQVSRHYSKYVQLQAEDVIVLLLVIHDYHPRRYSGCNIKAMLIQEEQVDYY